MKKILCLHGKQQNKQIFRTKLGRIPPKLKSLATLTIVDAPFDCEASPSSASFDADDASDSAPSAQSPQPESIGKTWFVRGPSGAIDEESLQRSISHLESVWREEGPFDGLLGFSMGGTLAAVISSENYASRFPGLQFLVCIGAPDVPEVLDRLSLPATLRSLHIAGESDTSVPAASSLALSRRFSAAEVCLHPQGHCIPMKAENVAWITQFVQKSSSS